MVRSLMGRVNIPQAFRGDLGRVRTTPRAECAHGARVCLNSVWQKRLPKLQQRQHFPRYPKGLLALNVLYLVI